jgi:ABC-type glycerol-3-phosphate transport system permease component
MSVQASTTPSAGAEVGKASAINIGAILLQIAKYILLVILAFSFMLPFIWMATSAVKNDSQVYTVPPIWIPNPALWENFYNAWTSYNFNLYMFNTVFRYAIPTTIGVTVSSAIVAYGFARISWKGRDVLFFICLATMMVPFQVTMVPLFITFKNFGLINTYWPLVLPAFFGSPYFIFMLRQFYRTIPVELSDAAYIDGANEFEILWKIILPLAKPALTVVALFQFMNAWNDYLGPLIYLNQENMKTVALGIEGLRRTITQVGSAQLAYPYLMAVSTLVTLPILIAFFFAQRTFIEGISLTGIKG